jgi:hypothetical protein
LGPYEPPGRYRDDPAYAFGNVAAFVYVLVSAKKIIRYATNSFRWMAIMRKCRQPPD